MVTQNRRSATSLGVLEWRENSRLIDRHSVLLLVVLVISCSSLLDSHAYLSMQHPNAVRAAPPATVPGRHVGHRL